MTPTIDMGSIVIIASEKSKYYSRFGFIYKVHKNGRLGVKLAGGHMVSYCRKSLRATAPMAPSDSPWKEDFEIVSEERDEYFQDPLASMYINKEGTIDNVLDNVTDNIHPDGPIAECTPSGEIQALHRIIQQLSQQLSEFSLETTSNLRTVHDNVRQLSQRHDDLAQQMSSLQTGSTVSIDSLSNSANADLVPMEQ